MKYIIMIFPLLTFGKRSDGTKEITFGWIKRTITIKF